MNQIRRWENSLYFFLVVIILTIWTVTGQNQQPDPLEGEQILGQPPINCQLGCKECDSEGLCTECVDNLNAKLEENICICISSQFSFTVEGYCMKCYADGCKHCQRQIYQKTSVGCAVCLDPEAKIIDGQCVCPDDTYMVDGMCQQDCPYYISEGKCKQCLLPGCKYCPDPHICSTCKDPYATNHEHSCECERYPFFSMNSNEYCTWCNSLHCKVCRAGKRFSTQCFQCIDPQASIIDGTCTCPTGQVFTSAGICKQCSPTEMMLDGVCVPRCQHTYGCSTCKDGICSGCQDMLLTLYHNQCKCSHRDLTVSAQGKCIYCKVPECKACKNPVAYSSYTCHECFDPIALTDDGRCVCPEGKHMVDGMCEDECPYFMVDGSCRKCKVQGCIKCPNDPTVCEGCIDPISGPSLSGLCVCDEELKTLNIDGYCVHCSGLGCKTCDRGSDTLDTCVLCVDPTAGIVGGKCTCPGGKVLNKEGICVMCSQPTEMVLNGVCVLRCEYTLGCQQCQDGVCSMCPTSSSKQYNQCICSQDGYEMTSDNICGMCTMVGCKICSQKEGSHGTINACFECLDPIAVVENGRCVCPDGKVLLEGYCEEHCPTSVVLGGVCQPCETIGCKLCPQSPAICQQCLDQDAYLSNGRCSCYHAQENYQINEAGLCTYCHTPYCKYCEADSQHSFRCIACMDPNAKIVDGRCTCAEGQGLGTEGLCRVCMDTEMVLDGACVPRCEQTFGCKTCHDGICSECLASSLQIKHNQCDCGDGQSIRTDNKCGYCLIPGCKVCEALEDSSPCSACIDPSAELVNGRCVCPHHQYLVQGICEDQCPYNIVNGECKKCLVEGCLVCDDPNYCTRCIDPNVDATKGKCQKQYCSSPHLNQVGYCAECIASACKTCQADAYHSSRCFQCVDPFAIVDNGACTCPEGKIFHARKQGFCRECSSDKEIVQGSLCVRRCEHSYGCSDCQEGVCNSCLQAEEITELRNNECICIQDRQAMTQSGECKESRIPGCAVISETNYYQCVECKDPDASLSGGKCICPEGQYMKNSICTTQCPYQVAKGQCEQIPVKFCLTYTFTSCEECVDADMMDSSCACTHHLMSPNQLGYCVFCFALGCRTCEATQPSLISYRCVECLDPDAIAEDGICVCPTQNTLNGMCYRCLAPGCAQCEDGNPYICKTCLDAGATVNASGECECSGGEMNPDGTCPLLCSDSQFEFYQQCVACLLGCAECSPENPNLCSSCDDGYYLESQFCYQCPEGCLTCTSANVCGSCASTHEPSEQACISKCNFPCQTCPGDEGDKCNSCVDGYHPLDTTCTQNQSCSDQNCVFCPLSPDGCNKCAPGFEEFRGKCNKKGKFEFGGNKELSAFLQKLPQLKLRLSQTLIKRY